MTVLDDVVADWTFRNHQLLVAPWGAQVLHKGAGMTDQQLIVRFMEEDADDPRKPAKMYEWKAPCPAFAVKDRTACERWVAEMIALNELHEIFEFIRDRDGNRPFCPHIGTAPAVRFTWPDTIVEKDS